MLPGLAEIAARAVTRTAAAELPSHVQPGRTWRNTRYDQRGTWHLPADGSAFADSLCGEFIVRRGVDGDDRWIAEGEEPATACRRCLRIVERRDAVEAAAERRDGTT